MFLATRNTSLLCTKGWSHVMSCIVLMSGMLHICRFLWDSASAIKGELNSHPECDIFPVTKDNAALSVILKESCGANDVLQAYVEACLVREFIREKSSISRWSYRCFAKNHLMFSY
jgi:hypothetical protein